MRFHDDGKASLEHIYTQRDPRLYFGTLRKLDYAIPQLAKPHFAALIAELRAQRGTVQVLDIGCSYGINGALLRCDTTMDELYLRYGRGEASRETLLSQDRAMVQARDQHPDTRFVGLDISAHALAYAKESGFIDAGVLADLENHEPTPEQRADLAGTDLAISTGCLGYITERTLARVVEANRDRPPWMAHFVLRMYPFDPVEQCLAAYGYETTTDGRVYQQRLFASPEEQSQVLDTLADLGVDPTGLETQGWLYAQLYISRPRATAS